MKAAEILKSLNGFIWEAIYKIEPEYYVEPDTEPGFIEAVLGPMTELEKALFSIKYFLLDNLLNYFNVDEQDKDAFYDFYSWLIVSTQIEFLNDIGVEDSRSEEFLTEQEKILVLRSQFLAAHDLLEMVTCQRFQLLPEDVVINYRKNNIVAVTPSKLMMVNCN